MPLKMVNRLLMGTLVLAVLLPAVSNGQNARRRGVSGPVVRSISIEGNIHFSDKRIKKVMRTEESRFLRTRRLRESTLERDLLSIDALYTTNGFLHANAVIDTLIYDKNHENVEVKVRIDEGRQTKVARIEFVGNVVVPTSKLERVVKMKTGEPLDERRIDQETYRLYTYYADQGYVFASIGGNVSGADGSATVTFSITEGKKARISDIAVRGNNRVKASLITREVTLRPGDVFSDKKLVDSQQKILDTGLFKDVQLEPRPGSPDSATVELVVVVKERRMREVSVAVGYGTRDEARLTTGWTHRNLWNTGRQFDVRSVLGSTELAQGLTRKRGDLALTDRWLFGRRLVGALGLYAEETLEEFKEVSNGEYTLDRYGINLSVKKDLSLSTQLTTTYTHEFADVRKATWTHEQAESLRLQVGQEVNRAATVSLERDTRKPFFDPISGSLTRISVKRAGGIFGGDNSYNKLTWSWARFIRVYFGSVLALSTRVGYTDAFGASKSVPVYERFYAGGSSSLRGYNDREFGPGDFLALVNVELRYPIVWKLGGVIFADAGNAWDSIHDVTRSDFDVFVPAREYWLRRGVDIKYSVGLGFGLQTPVGPVRVDYGFKVKRGVDPQGRRESVGRLHLTVGNAF
jgi:outer membrane protein insertion porin family